MQSKYRVKLAVNSTARSPPRRHRSDGPLTPKTAENGICEHPKYGPFLTHGERHRRAPQVRSAHPHYGIAATVCFSGTHLRLHSLGWLVVQRLLANAPTMQRKRRVTRCRTGKACHASLPRAQKKRATSAAQAVHECNRGAARARRERAARGAPGCGRAPAGRPRFTRAPTAFACSGGRDLGRGARRRRHERGASGRQRALFACARARARAGESRKSMIDPARRRAGFPGVRRAVAIAPPAPATITSQPIASAAGA
jgi:hypothetical protein